MYCFQILEVPKNFTSESLALVAEKPKVSNMKVEELKAYKKYNSRIKLSKAFIENANTEGALAGKQEVLQLGIEQAVRTGIKKGRSEVIQNAIKKGLPA